MCGLFARFGSSLLCRSDDDTLEWIEKLSSRGPDAASVLSGIDRTWQLGHTRLAREDLSYLGEQPLIDSENKFILLFNGEIYNHKRLRGLLPPGRLGNLKSESDSEVLIECLASLGVDRTLSVAVGAYAFVLFDIQERRVIAARDRFGEKPLYFSTSDGLLFLASIPSIVAQMRDDKVGLSSIALSSFLSVGFCASNSVFQGVQQFPADSLGVFLETNEGWELAGLKRISRLSIHKHGLTHIHSKAEALKQLDHLLNEIVADQIDSHSSAGAFLSGGVDSPLIAAIMQSQMSSPLDCFTVAYPNERDYDESARAAWFAKKIGAKHHIVNPGMQDIISHSKRLPLMFDEPFGDSSAVSTSICCEFASQVVDIILSGDGGDEVFWGYNRYNLGFKAWRLFRGFPSRTLLEFILKFQRGILLDLVHNLGFSSVPLLKHKLQKLSACSSSGSLDAYYEAALRQGIFYSERVDFLDLFEECAGSNELTDNPISKIALLDRRFYLPYDILTKVDRVSMANHIEVRCPLLDHRLLDWSLGLDGKLLQNKSQGKLLLRELLSVYFGRKGIPEAAKSGFGLPIRKVLAPGIWPSLVEGLNLDADFVIEKLRIPNLAEIYSAYRSGSANEYDLWYTFCFHQWANLNYEV